MTEPRPTSQQSMLMNIVADLAEIKAVVRMVRDHEERIRELEKARWQTAWLTGILSAGISSALVAIIIKTLGA